MEAERIVEKKYVLTVSTKELFLLSCIFNKISPSDLSKAMDGYISSSEIADISSHCKEHGIADVLKDVE